MKKHIRIQSRHGGKTHVTTEDGTTGQGPGRTHCGKRCDGWLITDGTPDCVACLKRLAVEMKP